MATGLGVAEVVGSQVFYPRLQQEFQLYQTKERGGMERGGGGRGGGLWGGGGRGATGKEQVLSFPKIAEEGTRCMRVCPFTSSFFFDRRPLAALGSWTQALGERPIEEGPKP